MGSVRPRNLRNVSSLFPEGFGGAGGLRKHPFHGRDGYFLELHVTFSFWKARKQWSQVFPSIRSSFVNIIRFKCKMFVNLIIFFNFRTVIIL